MRIFSPVSTFQISARIARARMDRRQSLRQLIVEQLEDRRLMAVIDLATLTPSQGSTLFGADTRDLSGSSVSSAGDVNGDGFDDLIVGAFLADSVGNAKSNAGESYLIFGAESLPATIDLASLGSAGITIFGAGTGDLSGRSVSSAGDVNGDGFDDLLIGAYGADAAGNFKPYAGESYVIFGSPSLPPTIDLATVGTPSGPAGITIHGADTGDRSGISVSSAGDLNGDGFDDLIIGAYRADGSANSTYDVGDSYVIFGGASLPATIDLAVVGTPAGTAGITFFGVDSGDRCGFSVSNAGDVNGDGFDDLLIGAFLADGLGNAKYNVGDSYVIFGGESLPATIDLDSLGAAGITVYGSDINDRSGLSVSNAGDVNGDGFDDLLIGAFFADASGNSKSNAGDSYIIFGADSLPTTIDLGTLGSVGITIHGGGSGDSSGRSVSASGDVNGDGFDDLLIGANRADASGNAKSDAGESYVIFGSASLPATIDLAGLDADGITIFGVDTSDLSGVAVSNAGDLNGDGFDDLLIGAYWGDASGNAKSDAGESYVIFGGDFTATITHQGAALGETLTGTAAADAMIGGQGNDTIVGSGGADALGGGQGNDILAVSDLSFKRVVGGTGLDTLRLDGSGLLLDLTTLKDNRLLGIESIEITGSGNNSLKLGYHDVLNISDESNILIVRRNVGDVVDIGSGWIQVGEEIIGPETFTVYTQGQATVKIEVANSAAVINHQIFYNRSTSAVFGNGMGNPTNAIDSTKSALLPGQTTSFANYTNYHRGLNGLVVDVANLAGTPSVADFQFATWDGIAAIGFMASTAVPTMTIIPGGGETGATRLKIEFADGDIRNTWLRVTLLANGNTGLSSDDVFYFGNAIGDMNAGNIGMPVTVRTNATDTSNVRQHQSTLADSVGITNIYDLNKDGRVNATDTSIVRQNQLPSILAFFTAPQSFQPAIEPDPLVASDSSVPTTDFVSALIETADPPAVASQAYNRKIYATTIATNATRSITALERPFVEPMRLQLPASKVESNHGLSTRLEESFDRYFAMLGKGLIH